MAAHDARSTRHRRLAAASFPSSCAVGVETRERGWGQKEMSVKKLPDLTTIESLRIDQSPMHTIQCGRPSQWGRRNTGTARRRRRLPPPPPQTDLVDV